MIKKAQITFIAITMTIVFAVFSAIYSGANVLLKNVVYAHTERVLDNTFETYTHNTEVHQADKIIIRKNDVCCEPETKAETVILLKEAASFPAPGINKVGNYFYRFYELKGDKVFVAADMTADINVYYVNNTKILFSLLCVFFALFILVYMLSFKIFKPIKDTLEKQKRFISDASHELKTPLTIISANADVLKQNDKDNQWIDNIKSQTERLDSLVADMLDLAKLDEKKPRVSEDICNVSEIVLETALPFDAVAFEKNKTLNLDIAASVTASADRNALKKITNILIDNAVKYSSVNGEIKVSVYKESGKAMISVYNTGSEIPDEKSHKIFERFYRGDDSRSRESGGSGLGLAIAKSIADNNKWKITAKSRFHESMTITVAI